MVSQPGYVASRSHLHHLDYIFNDFLVLIAEFKTFSYPSPEKHNHIISHFHPLLSQTHFSSTRFIAFEPVTKAQCQLEVSRGRHRS